MIQNLWPTPFLKTNFPEKINNDLSNHLFLKYDFFNNVGPDAIATESRNIFDDKSKIIKIFKDQIVIPLFDTFLKESLNKDLSFWKGYALKGWLTGSGKNYSSEFHNHRGSSLSAIFYLLCDDVDVGGNIHFTDPRQNSNRGYDMNFISWFENYTFVPKSGDAVVFPSFLYHYVSTYKGNIRLVLPVDLFLFNN
jgi:hypothetical protein